MIPTHVTANLHELRNRLRELAHLPDSPDPILSVYLDLRQGAEAALPELERRLGVLDRLLPSGGRPALAQASLAVRSLLLDRAWTGVSGLAVFARGGPVRASCTCPSRCRSRTGSPPTRCRTSTR